MKNTLMRANGERSNELISSSHTKQSSFRSLSMLIIVIMVAFLATITVHAALPDKTFAEQFPDPELAKKIATVFGKAVGDKLPAEVLTKDQLSLGYGNNIKSLEGISVFESLNTLALDSQIIEKLPAEFSQLKKLERLSMNNNLLTEFPMVLCEMPTINYLDLSTNRISNAVPPEIGQMSALETLILNNNNINNEGLYGVTKLPAEIGQLKNLKCLEAALNRIVALPAEISQCSQLNYLNLHTNRIPLVPDSISELKNLTDFYIHRNQLKTLPTSLAAILDPAKLTRFYCYENQIIDLDPSLYIQTPFYFYYRQEYRETLPDGVLGEDYKVKALPIYEQMKSFYDFANLDLIWTVVDLNTDEQKETTYPFVMAGDKVVIPKAAFATEGKYAVALEVIERVEGRLNGIGHNVNWAGQKLHTTYLHFFEIKKKQTPPTTPPTKVSEPIATAPIGGKGPWIDLSPTKARETATDAASPAPVATKAANPLPATGEKAPGLQIWLVVLGIALVGTGLILKRK